MVWKGVSEIGCAQNSRRIYICRYRSGDSLSKNTANMRGHYTEMVLPAVKSRETCEDEVGNSGGSPAQIPVPAPAQPAPTPAPPCVDKAGHCAHYASLGYCSIDHVRQHCAKTCGAC